MYMMPNQTPQSVYFPVDRAELTAKCLPYGKKYYDCYRDTFRNAVDSYVSGALGRPLTDAQFDAHMQQLASRVDDKMRSDARAGCDDLPRDLPPLKRRHRGLTNYEHAWDVC